MKLSLLFFTFVVYHVRSAKILGVIHMSAKSHYILGSALMTELASRGHDVTVISPFGEKNPPKNGTYTDIILTGFVEEHDKQIKKFMKYRKLWMPPIILGPFMAITMTEMTEKTLAHPNVQELINSNQTFDLVIVEEFSNHAHKALAAHFKAHLISLSTLGANSGVNNVVGNPTPLSYVGALFGSSGQMSFWERLQNTLTYVNWEIINHVYIYRKHQQMIDKYIPSGPKLEDVMHNASLVLLNSHESTNQPVPYVPQMVNIGGFHVKPPKKLPQDLQDYLDNSINGAIYFSLGSNVKGTIILEETLDAFLQTFAALKENILWKWEDDELPGKPPNVRLGKWLPQQDILAHPNVKLFITHAGLLSTTETIYHGVPVLALPMGGDQFLNAQKIVDLGFGLAINVDDVTVENLSDALSKLLSDPQYRKNAQTRSKIFHDREVKPMDTAMYWIEYVLRHGGTPHLRVAALDLPWYKYFLLDVIAIVAVVLAAVFFVFCILVKKLAKCFCSRSKKTKVKKN